MLRFLTAGESHGPGLTVILEGLPAGLELDFDRLGGELRRRQGGYGRGARMKIEKDEVEVLGGIRGGRTTGGPVAFLIRNRDWENWKDKLSPYRTEASPAAVAEVALSNPRPGHADLAGALKWGSEDFRDILERSSARETAARVAAGAVAKQFLEKLDCAVRSHVVAIGPVKTSSPVGWEVILRIPEDSPLKCADADAERVMMAEIDRAAADGDTLGGAFEVVAHTPPPGLGSFIQWDLRLDGRLAQALMSIPAMKAVGFGKGVEAAALRGSALHDEIFYSESSGLNRPTNNAGGLEGGITNGEELRVTVYMKPLSSLRTPLHSVDIKTKEAVKGALIRSDVSAVPAAGVVGEAMTALTLAAAALEKFGGDHLDETLDAHRAHRERADHILRETAAP